jgi:hypothetical protein
VTVSSKERFPAMQPPVERSGEKRVVNFVRQQHERGCGVACVAMLSGTTYEKVWQDQTSRFTPDEVLHFRTIQWSVYLNYLGFEVGFFGQEHGPILELLLQLNALPRGLRYWCVVGVPGDSDADNAHGIVVDENGIVYDPATDTPGAFPLAYYTTPPKALLVVNSVEDRRLL